MNHEVLEYITTSNNRCICILVGWFQDLGDRCVHEPCGHSEWADLFNKADMMITSRLTQSFRCLQIVPMSS